MAVKKKEYTVDRDDMITKFRVWTDDFKKLRDEGGYFVDKTLFIKEIIDGNEVTLIPRPRRFGKTLNMTMLRYFYERSEESRAYLFLEKIAKKRISGQYHPFSGTYPSILWAENLTLGSGGMFDGSVRRFLEYFDKLRWKTE